MTQDKCKKCGTLLSKLWVQPLDENSISPITSHKICLKCGTFHRLEPMIVGEEE